MSEVPDYELMQKISGDPQLQNKIKERQADGFNLKQYLEMTSEFEMSEEEKVELLTILWDIMKRFVELGWGLDNISLLGDENHTDDSKLLDIIVPSDDDNIGNK